MGKPFAQELACLQSTYDFCLNHSLETLEWFVRQALCMPLIAVGSGGSLTAAHFACLLHQIKGQSARPVTPFEFMRLSPSQCDTAVLFLSARGANPDVLTSFRLASVQEVRELGVLCTKTDSPLAAISRQTGFATIFETNLPSGKDGFLATNSLFATSVLLARAYAMGANITLSFPDDLVSKALFSNPYIREWEGLSRQTMIILHGGWSTPVAWDLESKFTEAALGNVQLADYRNFGHGRHHWLAKREDETSILALITPEEKEIAERTLRLLPQSVKILRLETDHAGPLGTVSLLAQAFTVVQTAGECQGIDPGKPGVPSFGRKLYHLSYRVEHPCVGPTLRIDTKEGSAIHRKTRLLPQPLSEDEETYWRNAYHTYVQSLTKARFGAMVLDYDGTLCHSIHRYRGLQNDIVEELVRLLRAGMLIGVATGRGKSVGQALRSALPSELHSQVIIGYYNGAHIHPLTEEIDSSAYLEPEGLLNDLAHRFEAAHAFRSLATLTIRRFQLTLEAHPDVCRERLFEWVQQVVGSIPDIRAELVRSTRSVDILAPGIRKDSLISVLGNTLIGGPGPDVLCVGDQGRWPGNDYALLMHRYSLSVDETSDAPDACWNLAPAGFRGTMITRAYLRATMTKGSYAHFYASKIRMGHKNEPEFGA